MNLKEAFRFQNKLHALMGEVDMTLTQDSNVMTTERTYLRHKVMAEAADETVVDEPNTEYAGQITEMTGFMLWLLAHNEGLAKAIRAAKDKLEIDMDSEVGLNKRRQQMAAVLQHMVNLRATEVLSANGGTGYRFNAEGNQVSYRCDVKKVTKINFDRNVVRKRLADLNKRIDEISAELDRCLVNGEVAYELPFNVNDSFADVFAVYGETLKEKAS